MRRAVVPILLALGAVACGSDHAPPPAPVELTDSAACGDAYFWVGTPAGDVAVAVTVEARDRSATEGTTIAFSVPDPDVTVSVLRGQDMARNVCTDVIDGASEPTSSVDAVAGEGEIVLGPVDPDGYDSCGTRGTLRLTGLEAPDGTAFAPVEVTSDEIGCYAG
jgi:hypothetical protein